MVLLANLFPVAASAQGRGIEIRSIQVLGLDRLDEKIVLSGLTIKAGDTLVGNATAKLNDAAESLFNTGWFQAKPELILDGTEDGAILKVTVIENPVYNSARIKGNTLFSTDRLLEEIEGTRDSAGNLSGGKMEIGEVINIRKIYQATDAILDVYHNAGYVAAGIFSWDLIPLPDAPNEAVLDIQVSEGIIEEVFVTGLSDTQERVVRGRITHLREGRVLTRADLDRDLNQIYNTGLFEAVNPELEPSLKEGYVKVVIEVEEAKTGQIGFGLGYSTINGIQGNVEYRENNLFGTGKQLNAMFIMSGNKPGYQLSYSDPYFTDNSFWSIGVFSLHNRQQRYPGQPYESEMGIDSKGATIGYGQRVSDYDSWQVTFGITDYDYTIRKGDPFRGYSPRQRARLSAEGETRKLGLSYMHDTRDNKFQTQQGIMAKGTAELAGFLGGDFSFSKYTFEGREFFKVGRGTMGFRQILGMATGDVPIYEQYRIGGVNSVRGVSEDLYYGEYTLLTNTEYRMPINDTFGAVAFVDMGWAGDSFSGMDHAAGAGVGARIKLPALGIGAVRLDYGWQLAGDEETDKRFHFFLGEMF